MSQPPSSSSPLLFPEVDDGAADHRSAEVDGRVGDLGGGHRAPAALGETESPDAQPGSRHAHPGVRLVPRVADADLVVAGLLAVFVFVFLNWPDPQGWSDIAHPRLLLDTTPSGGDMGAHVWGPAYLRDHLLTTGRLSGWTPDWYAGFPAFHFYMVVPALAIVAVNAGLPWFLGVPVAAGVLAGGWSLARRVTTTRWWIMAAAVVLAILSVGVPYGVAFKLVSVSGVVGFPLAAWAMGRLARAPTPVPAFLSMAAFIFLFDTNFIIYGGNIASTLAGEFAFSMSLCLSLLAIGMVIRGMDDQRWRAPAAIVVGLVALCHIIPVFFLIPALLLAVLAVVEGPRTWTLVGTVAFALIPIAFADGTALGVRVLAVAAVLVVIASAMVAEPAVARRAVWMLLVGPVSIFLTGFWLAPFVLRAPYFNDMGWERLDDVGPALLTVPIKIALPVAAIGFLLAVASRERIGMIFAGTGLLAASAVANLGEAALWNARLLPFYYLSVYVVAAVGVALVARYLAALLWSDMGWPVWPVILASTAAATVAVLAAVSMPLRIMPYGQESADGTYGWLAFTNQARSLVPTWAEWNYSGYEEKPSYGEYRHVVSTMAAVGEERGCGRAMWEYEKGLDRYGTPMALMLLPHWTDGCIGSMEGLYFESSSSTPFHFLNQSALSEAPSRAQRDLPYLGMNLDVGVAQLQVSGVRYYMAQSDAAIAAAREHPDLTEVAEAQPFAVFEVAGSELVEGLAVEPVVAEGRTAEAVAGEAGDPDEISRFDTGWVSQAVAFYNDPSAYPAMPAENGPEGWTRQQLLSAGGGKPVEVAQVSDIEVGTDSVAFSVDRVGSPVLVKMSYFPNWKIDGADGIWRVGPNLMVVVPTENRVELSYGWTFVDIFGYLLTLLGLVGLVGLGLMDRDRLDGLLATWTGEATRADGPLDVPQSGVDPDHPEGESSDAMASNGSIGGGCGPPPNPADRVSAPDSPGSDSGSMDLDVDPAGSDGDSLGSDGDSPGSDGDSAALDPLAPEAER